MEKLYRPVIRNVFILICLLVANIEHVSAQSQIYDLCGQHYNGRRVYLDIDRSAVISAKNVRILPLLIQLQSKQPIDEDDSIPQECRIEVVACPSCVIRFSVVQSNLSNHTQCDTDYIELTEQPYNSRIPAFRICNQESAEQSQTRNVLIRFVFTRDYDLAFDLKIEAKKNHVHVLGDATAIGNNGQLIHNSYSSVLSTPFFPMHYPRDYEVEYTIGGGCDHCQVHVNFIDFQLAPVSVLEIVDVDSEIVEIITGLTLRPRIFISAGKKLHLRFRANGGIGEGFNAEINLIPTIDAKNNTWNPNTDCGGYVDRLGGAITMLQMTNNPTEYHAYDCIWIIRPSIKYHQMKTHQSLQLASFSMETNSEITIRRGVNSYGKIIGSFTESNMEVNRTAVVAVADGFYIHMRGNFTQNSSLVLLYTVLSYSVTECYVGSDFMCANQICIPVQLHCDGFDHCGDGSDEDAAVCAQWHIESYNRQFTPNYYFPGTRYDINTTSIFFVSTSGGLIVLVSVLFLVLYRINLKARHQRELQQHLQTISELLEQNNNPQFDNEDEPPIYEAPPEYEEVIKVGMDSEIRQSKRQRREERARRKSRQHEDFQGTSMNTGGTLVTLTEPFPIEDSAALTQISQEERPQATLPVTTDSMCEVVRPSNAQGMLIVFQSDDPTAIPVHEFIPSDRDRLKSCLEFDCPQTENDSEPRLVRRYSADPLLPTSNITDMARSFRL